MNAAQLLPTGVTVFERGWLSSNNVLMQGERNALVDSGYCTHGAQTLALVQQALNGRSLDVLANTHLHSDHCGGNAVLQGAYPALQTLIPPAQALAVDAWDTRALTYEPTGQRCPRFGFDAVLVPGTALRLGDHDWQVHAAPGHDPHSVILFEPNVRCLISADALWENGFGVVFPELEGDSGFDEVADTLDLIESLAPQVVIPGHGAVFADVTGALERARSRLQAQRSNPQRHALHAAKVLIKYHLLEFQARPELELLAWVDQTALLHTIAQHHFPGQHFAAWRSQLLQDLCDSGALARVQRGDAAWVENR
jgi:glyoxylase-like metal-dependent hydrolase (beta-lactamase superfamily II)